MNLLILLLYFILGLILYIGNSYLIKRYDITKFKAISLSLIYIFVLAGVFNYYVNFTSNVFIVLVFYLIVDIVYTTYFMNEDFFTSKRLTYYLLLIFLGFILNNYFINKVDNVFLDSEQLKIVLWVLIFIYLYRTFMNSKIYTIKFKTTVDDTENILYNYVKLKNKYNLSYEDKDLVLVIYSMMIINNKKRNAFMRSIDEIFSYVFGTNKKKSIMLIDSDKKITDKEAIDIVYKDLVKLKKKNKTLKMIIKKYDNENYERIYEVVKKIKDYFN